MKIMIYREPADTGAGADGGAPPPSAPAAPNGQQTQNTESGGGNPPPPPAGQTGQDNAPGPGAAYRPDGLPEHFVGANDQETIDKMAKALDGFRKSQSERGETPKEATGYEWAPDGAVKDYAEAAQDQVFESFKGIAHKHGLTTKQFNGVVNDFLNNLIDGGLVDAPFNPDAEKALLAPDIRDPAARNAAVEKIITENVALVKTYEEQKIIDKATADWLLSQADRAAMHKLMDAMKTMRGEAQPAIGGEQPALVNLATIKERTADPRNQFGKAEYDPAFAAETNRLSQAYDKLKAEGRAS